MREIVSNLFSDSEHHDLYQGVIETVEGIVRDYPEDAWQRKMLGDEELDKKIDEAVYSSGLMALGVEEKYGGMGGGLLGQVMVVDMMAQKGLYSFAQTLTSFSRAPLISYGTPEQIEKYVGPSLTGEKRFCILATEPNAGTNTFNISTKAERKGDGWVLNGQKIYVSQAAESEYGFLISKTASDPNGGLSVFMLDMNSPGVSMQPLNLKISGRDQQYSVFFDDVEMPADALVGKEGQGAKYMFSGLNAERLVVAALSVGTSDLALTQAIKYVNERKVFADQPTGSYQAVQHPLARYKADTDAARLMMYHGVKQFDEGKDAGMYANMAKLLASDAATNMADAVIQCHGGSGMDEDTGIQAIWRMARAMKIAPINNEMVLNFVAQKLGLPRSY